MNDQIAEDPQTILDRIQQQATRYETPCGDGKMVWHLWDQSGGTAPVVVLFHGGAGSWRHWIRTIPALVPTYRVLVPDLPGLGESDFPPDGDDAVAIAAIVADGIDLDRRAPKRRMTSLASPSVPPWRPASARCAASVFVPSPSSARPASGPWDQR